MNFIRKYSYLRALVIGFPLGVASIIIGITSYMDTSSTIDNLHQTRGKIDYKGIKIIYSTKIDADIEVFIVKVGKNEFYTELGKYKSRMIDYFQDNNKADNYAHIWHRQEINRIEQISVDGFMLIEYSPPYWIAHFFFWLGLITLITAIGYVIKHPEDLKGKKE